MSTMSNDAMNAVEPTTTEKTTVWIYINNRFVSDAHYLHYLKNKDIVVCGAGLCGDLELSEQNVNIVINFLEKNSSIGRMLIQSKNFRVPGNDGGVKRLLYYLSTCKIPSIDIDFGRKQVHPDYLGYLSVALSNDECNVTDFLWCGTTTTSEDLREIKIFSKILETNKSIRRLFLSGDFYGNCSEGLKLIFDGLKKNTSVVSLYISVYDSMPGRSIDRNLWGQKDAIKYFSDMLKNNATITKLCLSRNSLGDYHGWLEHFSKIIENNSTITDLNLGFNYLGGSGNSGNDTGMTAFAKALGVNKSIKHINLDGNCLYDCTTGTKSLFEAFGINHTLETISISDNGLDGETDGWASLPEALITNPTIREFWVVSSSASDTTLAHTPQYKKIYKIESRNAHNNKMKKLSLFEALLHLVHPPRRNE